MKHANLLKQLLPPVSIDPNGTRIAAELEADGRALDRVQADAHALAAELDPESTAALLPDWERVFGLPDPCMEGEAQMQEQRRAALVAKVVAQGGQDGPYFVRLAEALGYPGASITEFRPATCADPCDAMVAGEEWRIVWRINLTQDTAVWVANCESPCTSPLASWGNRQLECLLRRYKPSDSTILFSYGAPE